MLTLAGSRIGSFARRRRAPAPVRQDGERLAARHHQLPVITLARWPWLLFAVGAVSDLTVEVVSVTVLRPPANLGPVTDDSQQATGSTNPANCRPAGMIDFP